MWFGKFFYSADVSTKPQTHSLRELSAASQLLSAAKRAFRTFIQPKQTLAISSPQVETFDPRGMPNFKHATTCALRAGIICTVCFLDAISKLLAPKLRQHQSFVSIQHHAYRPAVDEEEQRAALEVANLLHI